MIGHLEQGTFLHHYTSSDNALKILESEKLWLSPMSGVNDPKEFSNWQLDYHPGDLEISFDEWMEINAQISIESKRITKLAYFSQDILTKHSSATERYIDIGCIGRGFANSPMWHFYGMQHTGVCLMFNGHKLIDLLIEQSGKYSEFYGSIDYKNEKLVRDLFNDPYHFNFPELKKIGLTKYTENFIKERFGSIYFKKHTVWNYENEYRFMIISDSDEPFKLDFKDALEHICYGVNCSPENKLRIEDFAKKRVFGTHELKFKNASIQIVM